MPRVDFSSESFSTHREPLRELITTFSDLYIDSDEDHEVGEQGNLDDINLPPPPPVEEETPREMPETITSLIERTNTLEGQVKDCVEKFGECVTHSEFQTRCQAMKDRILYRVRRECERVENKIEVAMRDLGQSVIDCLKRRNVQLENKLKALVPPTSTPVSSRSGAVMSKTQDQTYDVSQHQVTFPGNSSLSYNPPVKLDFPCFGDGQDKDRIVFIEHCEEYFAVRPLSDCEIVAALTSVLKGTAKDWWQAEKINVQGWRQFKEIFLRSFQ